MWINLKCKYIMRDGKSVKIGRGDPIPEAEFWPNRDRLARNRFIKWIPDAEAPKAPPVKIEREPKKKVEVSEVKEEKPEVVEEKPKAKKRGRPKKVDTSK